MPHRNRNTRSTTERRVSRPERVQDDTSTPVRWSNEQSVPAMTDEEEWNGLLGNLSINEVEIQAFIESNTVPVAQDFYYTYVNGERQVHNDPSAPRVSFNIHFVAGGNQIQAYMEENDHIDNAPPSQNTPSWRVLTAGNLLIAREHKNDHLYRKQDVSEEILKNHWRRKRTKARGNELTRTATTINIHSTDVKLVNASSRRTGADYTCTCIEIDGSSVIDLIRNFRELTEMEGVYPRRPVKDTIVRLERMAEDARKLWVRSPNLSQIRQRTIIQRSENTTYGSNIGDYFVSLTTSQGIKGIIRRAVGWYSDMNRDKEEMLKIRPKFMQTLVLLLALLNDQDLESIKRSLQQSYGLRADRKSIELTIFKVLYSESVAPQQFLSGILSAFGMDPRKAEGSMDERAQRWNELQIEAASLGWIVPGPFESVGRTNSDTRQASWMVDWNRDVRFSDVFDHLQYCGEYNTVNCIPSLSLGESLNDANVTAEFANGETFYLKPAELDHITHSSEGHYSIIHPETRIHGHVDVEEKPIFEELKEVSVLLKKACDQVNTYRVMMNRAPMPSRGFLGIFGSGTPRPRVLQPYSCPTVLSRVRCTTSINIGTARRDAVIAISWKYDGKRQPYTDFLVQVLRDIQAMTQTLKKLSKWLEDNQNERTLRLFGNYHRAVEIVKRKLDAADEERRTMEGAPLRYAQEAIIRTHFPNYVNHTQDLPWCDYKQHWNDNDQLLCVESKTDSVATVQWRDGVAYAELQESGAGIAVMPLTSIDGSENARNELIQQRDRIILLGGIVATVSKRNNTSDDRYRIQSYMRLTALVLPHRPRRGRVNPNEVDNRGNNDGFALCRIHIE